MKNFIDAKMDSYMGEFKVLINTGKRSSSSLRRRSNAKTPELPSPASTQRHRHRQDQQEQPSGRELAALAPSCTRACDPRAHRTPCTRDPVHTASCTPVLMGPTEPRHRPQGYGFIHYIGIFANSTSSSPRLPRATTTSTPTTSFLSMGLKTPRSISSGSARWTTTSSYIKSPPKIK